MKRTLNLAPPGIRRRQAMRRLVHACSTAITLAGAASATWLLVEWSRGAAMAQALGRLEAEYAPLERLMEEDVLLRGEIERLRAREQMSLRLTTDRIGLPLLAVLAQAATEAGGDVYVEELHYHASSQTTRNRRTVTQDGPKAELEGVSRDSLAVARFAQELRRSKLFTRVSIESSQPAPGSGDLRQFEIACAF